MTETIYRCPLQCQWKKNCFVCKIQGTIREDIVILHKCVISKQDIPVHLHPSKNV